MKLSFIKLDIDIMNDTKIKIIRKMPSGSDMLIIWIGILCLAMKSGKLGHLEVGDGIPFNDELLSAELDVELNIVRLALDTFKRLKMLEVFENGDMYITNFEKHQELEKIELARQKTRVRVQNHRDKVKQLCNGYSDVTVTQSNATDIDLDIDQDKDKEIDKDKIKKEKTPRHTFQPPTLDEVTSYCKERNNVINPQKFIAHYEARGWMLGKSKMKDWKACIRTWEGNNFDNPKSNNKITGNDDLKELYNKY